MIRESRPTVEDEVRQSLGVVEENLLDVIPRVYRTIEAGLGRVYPDRDWRVPPFLRFGSWIGGDRDGHPGVSAVTTAEAIRLQQADLLKHYLERMEDLWRRLSHSDRLGSAGAALRESLAKDAETFPDVVASLRPRALPDQVQGHRRQAPQDPRILRRVGRARLDRGGRPAEGRESTSAGASCSPTSTSSPTTSASRARRPPRTGPSTR